MCQSGVTCLSADCGTRIMCRSGVTHLLMDCCWLRTRIMCQSGVTCLSADCGTRIMCPSGVTHLLMDCCWLRTRIMCQSWVTVVSVSCTCWSSTISSKCNFFSPLYTCSWKIVHLALNNNHSLKHWKQINASSVSCNCFDCVC
jgi:hypothetical protein